MNPSGQHSGRVRSQRPQGGTMLRVLGAAQKREVKATQNLSIIVLFFIICWMPLYTINCIKAFCPDCYIHEKLTFFAIILSHLNSAVNPLLYAYHLRDFRAALKTFIMKMVGIDAPPQPELNYRLSMASQAQQRLQSIEKRVSLQPRIYIDSPIWLRSQQQSEIRNGTGNAINCSLNTINQTVAAIASVNGDTNREMWRIVEVPSADADENSKNIIENNSLDGLSLIFKSYKTRISSDDSCKAKVDDEDDDDVFIPEVIKNDTQISSGETTHYFPTELPFYSDSAGDDTISLPTVMPPLAASETSDTSLQSCCSYNLNSSKNSLFLVENDKIKLSTISKVPVIVPSTKMKNNLNGKIYRSNSSTDTFVSKPSPLKVVSNFIFPPNTHSRFLHLLDHRKNGNTLKRTLSDS